MTSPAANSAPHPAPGFLTGSKPARGGLGSDLSAGLTSAVVNVPQSTAQALLAGVNPVFGIDALMVSREGRMVTQGQRKEPRL